VCGGDRKHHRRGVRGIRRAYSPDFNPIEEAFSKIKGVVRRAEARTQEALIEALRVVISAVTAQDARGYFEHCGYSPSARSFSPTL
jgi:transposase